MATRIMIVTGEVSGDIYGSLLAEEITRIGTDIEICGVGGDRMRAAGVDTFLDSDELSVVGFWEAIVRLRKLGNALSHVKSKITELRPDLLILIDYPGMNLRLAQFAKEKRIKVFYYVSPQVWAWGHNRIRIIRKSVDKMAVILPFEVDIYEKEGVDVTYVGHPLIDIVKTELDRETYLTKMGIASDRNLVTLLPGSRIQEIRHHVQPLVSSASALREQLPSVDFLMVSLPRFRKDVERQITRLGESIPVTTDHTYEALRYSDLAISCSGTVTLEATLLGTPTIVIYKLALFSWALGRMIVKVPYISLTNLVAEDEVVPEFIQGAVHPKALADEAIRILTDQERRNRMIGQLAKVRDRLGPGGATQRTARLALSLIGN
jgi:lipid-A-disaccharide synthase